ncbi:MAG: SEC-C metal-binding domain-containing protein [Minicystis sp.]
MAKLDKPHVTGRVQTQERAAEVMAFCDDRGWYVTLELAADKPEDLSDLERQMRGLPRGATPPSPPKVGRNEPCSCGSGLKFKKCHGK